MNISFSKLQGSGNDFIIIDNREGKIEVEEFKKVIPKITRRALSIGADGVIIIENCDEADFKWRFFNSDGSEAEMCGNGGRCAARFAYERNIAPRKMKFLTLAGIIEAEVIDRRVKIQLTEPKDLTLNDYLEDLKIEYSYINTGVPHVVIFSEDIENVPVEELGRKIRFHKRFSPKGTNVNFVKKIGDKRLAIRTYERGVEGETFACGTGATASALIAIIKGIIKHNEVEVLTRSGEILKIYYTGNGKVFLEGETRWVYDGIMREEAYL
ncbi:MAG: diaminopimelate epimerase [Thermosulfidibacteraceae bacterium]|jgi:diaminopimelate epimerase